MMGNGGFSKTVVGFPGGGRGKRSVRQRRLFVQPFKCFVSAIPPAPLVSSGVPPLPPPPIRRGFPFPGVSKMHNLIGGLLFFLFDDFKL